MEMEKGGESETAVEPPQPAPEAEEEESSVAAEVSNGGPPKSEGGGKAPTPNDSEYDSAGSYTDDDDEKQEENREKGEEREDREDREDRAGTDDERSGSRSDEESVGFERESGDGQESIPARKVDDDEDKKNPQYIPKRGTFYEHDDRTADDVETENVPEAEKEADPKKKIWQDKKERWSHDRFDGSEQAPKSKAELVAIYGYDIRNEDGPPRARRRRRYGRGPNKYTRNWEDEDAYNKPPPVRTKKPPPHRPNNSGEDYPPLEPNSEDTWEENNDDSNSNRQRYDNNDRSRQQPPQQQHNSDRRSDGNRTSNRYRGDRDRGDRDRVDRDRGDRDRHRKEYFPQQHHEETNRNARSDSNSNSNSNSNPSVYEEPEAANVATSQQQPQPESAPRPQSREQPQQQQQQQQSQHQPPQQQQQRERVGSGRVAKPAPREIKDSDYKGFTSKIRQGRIIKTDQKVVPRQQQQQQHQQHQQHQQQQQQQQSPQKHEDFIETQNFTSRNMADVERDMGGMSILDPTPFKQSARQGHSQRQGSVPPRLQQQASTEQKGPKRYSSMRQRSLPESQTPPFTPQHSNYYPQEYTQQVQVPQQTILHQSPQLLPPAGPVQVAPPQIPSQIPPLVAMSQVPQVTQVPVTTTQILQPASPQYFPQAPPPQFLQPGVAPPAFLQAQQAPPQIIGYVPSQPQFPQGYQGYQQPTYNAVTQPAELYQPQTGITYYSTDQQILQRPVPLKRPKAAIPIVAPPPTEYKCKLMGHDDGDTELGEMSDHIPHETHTLHVENGEVVQLQ